MNKKYALCLYGKVGSAQTWKEGASDEIEVEADKVFPFWKENLLDHNDIDVFIHSWSDNQKKEIVQLYKPKDYIIENQRSFSVLYSLLKMFKNGGYRKPFLFFYNIWSSHPIEKQLFWKNRIKAARSRWYSTARSLELALNYENKYDLIISARIDLILKSKINLDTLKTEYFYAAHFNRTPVIGDKNESIDMSNKTHIEKKFSDLIFISNPTYIKSFLDIDKNFHSYSISPHSSSYEAVLRNCSKDQIKFYLYPWKDFETVKSFFYDWKIPIQKEIEQR